MKRLSPHMRGTEHAMHKRQESYNGNNLSTLTFLCENIVGSLAWGRFLHADLVPVFGARVASACRVTAAVKTAELWVTFSEGPSPALCLWSNRCTCETQPRVSVCLWGKETKEPVRMCRCLLKHGLTSWFRNIVSFEPKQTLLISILAPALIKSSPSSTIKIKIRYYALCALFLQMHNHIMECDPEQACVTPPPAMIAFV